MPRRLFLLAAAGLLTTPALATNGYFSEGYGTLHKGLAGAGAALPLSSLSTATNQAGPAGRLGDLSAAGRGPGGGGPGRAG